MIMTIIFITQGNNKIYRVLIHLSTRCINFSIVYLLQTNFEQQIL